MRLRFEDQALRELFEDESSTHPRLGRDLVRSYRKKVHFLAACLTVQDVRVMKSFHLEKLSGTRKGEYSIRLNDQWRLILRFERSKAGEATVVVVEVVDYH